MQNSFQEKNDNKTGAILLVVISLFVILQFFLQGSIGIMSSQIKVDLNLDASGISLISSAFFCSYIIMQIPAGVILDKYGMRHLPWTIICIGVFCYLLSRCDNLYCAILTRVITGACAAFAFLAMLSCIKIYFAKRYFAFLMSLTETFSMLGVWASNWMFSQGVMKLGWRQSMLICGILSLTLAATSFILFKKLKIKKPNIQREEQEKEPKWSVKKIICNKQIWLNGLFCGALYCVVTAFVSLWSIPYLGKKYNLNVVEATNLSSCVYIGIALASPFIGWLSQYVKMRKLLMPNAVICSILTTAIIYLPLPKENYFLHIIMFLIGASCSAYQLSFTIIGQITPVNSQGLANGVTNMICMSGAPILQVLIGLVLTLTQNGILDGYENYSVGEYQIALWIIPLTLCSSIYLARKITNPTQT
jgi:MFS family permease